jgi:hypothetical protein
MHPVADRSDLLPVEKLKDPRRMPAPFRTGANYVATSQFKRRQHYCRQA